MTRGLPSRRSLVLPVLGLALTACARPLTVPAPVPATSISSAAPSSPVVREPATPTRTPAHRAARQEAAKTADASVSSWGENLATSFERLQGRMSAASGIAIVVVGRQDPVALGRWRNGPAWSTSKVPLAIAALQHADTPAIHALVRRAITASDNAAAEGLWAELGAGPSAGAAVDAVLRAHGDRRTRTQWRQVRAPFTPFGQTSWALLDQVAFTAGLACDSHVASVLDAMGRVVPEQRWGLGRLAGARLKGGWGPDEHGGYLARQLALVPRGRDTVAVAAAAYAPGGFGQAVATLDEITGWLRTQLPALPSAPRTCS